MKAILKTSAMVLTLAMVACGTAASTPDDSSATAQAPDRAAAAARTTVTSVEAVPGGLRILGTRDGVPFDITLVAPAAPTATPDGRTHEKLSRCEQLRLDIINAWNQLDYDNFVAYVDIYSSIC